MIIIKFRGKEFDSNEWLFGSDIQTGICGFGKSVISALSNLRDNLNKNINNGK